MHTGHRPVLVTGASRGIGRGVAARFADGGHPVLAVARNADELQALAGEHPNVIPVALDLSDPAAVEATIPPLLAEHGGLHALVNNAGYGYRGAVEEIDVDGVRRLFEVNLFSVVRLTQLVLPGMRKAGTGTIVMVSSVAGELSTPFSGAYASSKFALEAISDALRLEVARFGIRVVVVQPGPVATHFLAAAADSSSQVLDHAPDSPYAEGYAALQDGLTNLHGKAWPSEAVEKLIVDAVAAPAPMARIAAHGATLHAARWLKKLAPTVLDVAVARRFKR